MAKVLFAGDKLFDLEYPDPAMINMDAIALSLSRIVRFSGQTKFAISVAQHCIWCMKSAMVPYCLHTQLYALLHDAPEAFTGDITSPVQRMLWISCPLRWIQEDILKAIYQHLGVALPSPAIMNRVDEIDRDQCEKEMLCDPLLVWSDDSEVKYKSYVADLVKRIREQAHGEGE